MSITNCIKCGGFLDVDYDETGFCDKCDGFICNECWEFKDGKVVCPKCGKEIG